MAASKPRRHPILHSTHSRKVTREQLDQPVLGLLYGGRPRRLHAGVVRGPRPGKTLCSDTQMFQHPLFARDVMFAPGIPADERHAYAIKALELNYGSSCDKCLLALIEAGGYVEYPYLDPTRAT